VDNPRQEIFLFFKMSRSDLGPTQTSIQWVMGALTLKKNGQDVRPTTHVHLGVQHSCDSFIFYPPEAYFCSIVILH